ncbi:WD repeat-containing protein WRAP73 [Trichonephila inaurata madagascariensis]|uniref:WD repeat-containing protein WRAP73 n=1 Tax=Trichonephila inaurata madagascariensis TaxID=2747483 RepID=A0A8X6Y3V7_9ARAC|nr:WD repeat-containing protein WRAP73 [Trichonephila inaurata madagascariensis]
MFQDIQSVNFSELIEQNVDTMSFFSPNGLYIACALQHQLLILDVDAKQVTQKFLSDHPIDYVGWSPDSELIYCCMMKHNLLQVWNLTNPVWKCKISENPLAIADVHWAPDSRHLLVISEFYLKMTVWSLVSSTIAVIENPKPIKKCLSFSHCERYLAVAERRKCEDYISIYTCDTWEILKFFSVETKDLSGIYFSPSDLVLGILEAFTEEPKVIFYSIDGRILGKYVKLAMFGFTFFSWNTHGNLIALGDYFGEVTVLDGFNYRKMTSYQELENIESQNLVIYKVKQHTSRNGSPNWELCEVVKHRPFALPSLASQSERSKTKHAKYGIQTLQYSSCNQYLALLNGLFPKVLFVLDLRTLRLSSIVVHQHKIKEISWHPQKPILAFSSGSENVDLWTPSSCISIKSPFKGEFPVINAKWCSKDDCLLLNGKGYSSVLYLPNFSSKDLVIS